MSGTVNRVMLTEMNNTDKNLACMNFSFYLEETNNKKQVKHIAYYGRF